MVVYNRVIAHINSRVERLIFLDAPGGTGKAFLINLILAKVSSDNVALAAASSGIAAKFL